MASHKFNLKLPLLSLVTSVILTGCTLGPDYLAPELAAPAFAANVEHNSATTGISLDGSWWQQFNDPVLAQLVELTLENNPSIAAARANMRAAYAVFSDVDNDKLPNGELGLGYQVQKQLPAGGDNQRVVSRSLRTGLNLNWTLDLFGRLERTAQAAAYDAQASQYAWQNLQTVLVSRVAETYATLRGLEERVAVAKANVASLKRSLNVVQLRVNAGYAGELDLLRITAQLKGAQARIPALESDAEQARSLLFALIGGEQMLEDEQWIAEQLPALSQPVALANPVQLLRRRADVLIAERKLAAATARVGASEAALYPELSVTGFLGFLSPSASLLGNQSKAWQVAPSISWPVFDLSSRQAQVDIANAKQQMALAELQQKWLDAVAETRTALISYTKAQQQTHLLNTQVAISSRALELAQLQFDAGAIDLLDLLDSERVALSAQDNRILANTQTFVALTQIYRALGGAPQTNAASTS